MMELLKKIFRPLSHVSRKTFFTLVCVETVVALVIWQLSCNALIPTPTRVLSSFIKLINSKTFLDNFFSSMGMIFEGMGISIIIALLVSYLSVIPFFKPIAQFIVKCRYLTLSGLVFLFTLLTSDGHSLKISLLIFGIVPFFVTSLLSILNSINIQEFELCETLRMSNWATMLEVIIIGRLDQVFEVMRQNFAIAWMMITMVEGLNMSEGGLGSMMIKSSKYIDLGTVFSLLLVILLIGILFDVLLGQLRFWLFPYAKLESSES
jgi:ABC-type nitrate/sulfonate/bicarbonate transport system permease component